MLHNLIKLCTVPVGWRSQSDGYISQICDLQETLMKVMKLKDASQEESPRKQNAGKELDGAESFKTHIF